QLAAVLAPFLRYHLTEDQLVVWTDREGGQASAYDLRGRRAEFRVRTLHDVTPAPAPPLEPRRGFFSPLPLTWEPWTPCWQRDQRGEGHPDVFGEEMRLWPEAIQVVA